MKRLAVLVSAVIVLCGCRNTTEKNMGGQFPDTVRIVSLNGTVSEIIAGLGLEKNIAGVDITSNYPESLKSKPKIGHNRNVNVEGVLALQPDIVTAIDKEVSPQLAEQFKAAGIKLLLFKHEFSVNGARTLIRSVGDSLQQSVKADSLVKLFDNDLVAAQKQVVNTGNKPKILFIYARGTGTMMVGGTGTQVEKVIDLAGGQNAIKDFADYKPLTPESLVEANPDIILLFDNGLESLGGTKGLLNVQGIAQTNAGKNKRFITMNGELLSSFGLRLGQAISELSDKMNKSIQ